MPEYPEILVPAHDKCAEDMDFIEADHFRLELWDGQVVDLTLDRNGLLEVSVRTLGGTDDYYYEINKEVC